MYVCMYVCMYVYIYIYNYVYTYYVSLSLSIYIYIWYVYNVYIWPRCCIIGNYYSLKGEHEKSVTYFQRALCLDLSV